MNEQSDNVESLFTALAAAQATMAGAKKDSTNPGYHSKYADLASCWDACREPLAANGLSVIQLPSADGARVTIRTILAHKTGQWIASELTLTSVKSDPQGIGSAITYGRRYGLSAMVGISPEDDDGNAASGGKEKPTKTPTYNDRVDSKLPVPVAMLNTIKGLSEIIGDVPYRECLNKHNFKRFSDIKTMQQATALLDELGEIRKEQESDNELATKLLASIDQAEKRY